MEGKLIKTQDGFVLLDDESNEIGQTFGKFKGKKLSLKNCQSVENGYDLEELAKSEAIKISETEVRDEKLERIYKRGFQKALEILGDKKFSENDMRMIFKMGVDNGFWRHRDGFKYEDESIKSLKQTEWLVEIEIEPYHDGDFIDDGKTHIIEAKLRPRLDSDGCLILKRI